MVSTHVVGSFPAAFPSHLFFLPARIPPFMLTNTFTHLPGVGLQTEQRFWAAGVRSWDDFAQADALRLSAKKLELYRDYLAQSAQALAAEPSFFTRLLPASQHWRLFPHYRQAVAYLDIETTGLDRDQGEITTIALYDGARVRYYVNGDNLGDFADDIQQFKLLVTYNGKTFDQPFIERFFRITLNQAHIDLRYVLHSLGYRGGLKSCEKQFGLDRGELDGVDGYLAVLLWREYKESGNPKALATLLAYNIQDVVGLEVLMVAAYNLHLRQTPFLASHQLAAAPAPELPFQPDPGILAKMKRLLAGLQPSYGRAW